MANLGVNITGNERDLLRAFKSSERGARQFDREMGRVTRGALRGSGVFKGLGRSVAFASGAFIGAAGFTEALRASVDAAEEFGKASRGLNAQLRANRENVKDAAPAIEVANAKLAKFGQTAIDSEAALARLDRATGNIRQAINLEGLTANFAAARHISLAQAALVVGKVVQGTTTAFNRFGLVVKKGTSVQDALRKATEKFAGQAAASVTPLEKLHASVTNLESILGEGLLPIINQAAGALTKFLNTPGNQKRIRTDVEQTASAFEQLAGGIRRAADDLNRLKKQNAGSNPSGFIVPGFVPFASSKRVFGKFANQQGIVGPIGGGNLDVGLRPDDRARGARVGSFSTQGGSGRTGFTAQGNKFFDAALTRRLDRVQDVRTLRGQVSALTEIAALLKQRLAKTKDVTRIATLEDDLVNVFRQRAGIRGQIATNTRARSVAADESILARLGFGVDKATATKGIQDDITALNVLAAGLRKQIAKGGDVLALQQQLFGVTQQIAETRAQARETRNAGILDRLGFAVDKAATTRTLKDDLAAQTALAAALRKQLAADKTNLDLQRQLLTVTQQIAETRTAQASAPQFAVLGLGPTGEERIPAIAALRKQLGTVEKTFKGSVLDTSANRKILRRVRNELNGQFKSLTADVRARVKELLDALTPDKAGTTPFRGANINALLSGLGLSPDEVRALRSRLSRVGPNGTTPITGSGAFGVITSRGGSGHTQLVGETTLMLDGWQLGRAQTKFTQTRQRRNPPQKRGQNAGQ